MAVPFKLIAAPRGKTKLVIDFGIFNPTSAHSMVTGRVAFDEEVENATTMAGFIAFQNLTGENLPIAITANEITNTYSAFMLGPFVLNIQ